jgi:hypothetical protein
MWVLWVCVGRGGGGAHTLHARLRKSRVWVCVWGRGKGTVAHATRARLRWGRDGVFLMGVVCGCTCVCVWGGGGAVPVAHATTRHNVACGSCVECCVCVWGRGRAARPVTLQAASTALSPH